MLHAQRKLLNSMGSVIANLRMVLLFDQFLFHFAGEKNKNNKTCNLIDFHLQWRRQGGACRFICTQSIHQCTLYCDVYLAHVHVLVAVYLSWVYVLLAKSPSQQQVCVLVRSFYQYMHLLCTYTTVTNIHVWGKHRLFSLSLALWIHLYSHNYHKACTQYTNYLETPLLSSPTAIKIASEDYV